MNKISQVKLIKSQIRVYSDEDGKVLLGDILLFFGVPICFMVGMLFLEIHLKKNFNLDIIHGFVAFLSGFVFSAYVIFLSFKTVMGTLTASRMKAAAEKTIKEIAIISLTVFLSGLFIVILATSDAIMKSIDQQFSISRSIMHSMSVFLFVFVVLNLLMIVKKLSSLIDSV
jgi:hypothetical protein